MEVEERHPHKDVLLVNNNKDNKMNSITLEMPDQPLPGVRAETLTPITSLMASPRARPMGGETALPICLYFSTVESVLL